VGVAARLGSKAQLEGRHEAGLALTLDSKGIIIPDNLSFCDRDDGRSIHRIMYVIENKKVVTQDPSTVKNERRRR
jgi:hypothetical protein